MLKNCVQQNKQSGFTLIELMVTVAIIGILVGLAYPSYERYLIRSYRVDAKTALLKIRAEQEKNYLENNTYLNDAAFKTANTANNWFQVSGSNVLTENGYYTLSIEQIGTTPFTENFSAKATVVSTNYQSKDKDCASFSINSSGVKSAVAGTGGDASKCWK
ncbi:MAG: type IV pilin protein [Gammaproteobacteria bacterium]|nr:type IV pilin protein [Gammaproteobacteria bacterium]NNC97668.1 type IV pilin protein [Gammaproteobacteria bacterium]NNM12844.1 type IV pilin protein [Gammaproteobacteria bacterium]